jgi:hypothetical protein
MYNHRASLSLLRLRSVHADNDGVVPMVGLKGELLLGLALLLTELVDLRGIDGLGGSGRVNAVSLDRHDEPAAVLKEHVGVHGHDTGLVGLGNIGEDDIDHTDEHAVLEGLTGVLNDGHDVGALLGHVGQVTAGTVGELHGIDHTLGADHVGHVGDGSTAGTTEVEDLAAGLDGHVGDTTWKPIFIMISFRILRERYGLTNDGGTELRTERVPHTVLNLVSFLLQMYHRTLRTCTGTDTNTRRIFMISTTKPHIPKRNRPVVVRYVTQK